jgi:hypothetical protein
MNISRRVAGRRLLEKLLPRAEQWLDEHEGAMPADCLRYTAADSPIAKASAQYQTLKNAEAVFITEGELGGWIADIMFKSVPAGVYDMVGTPVASPHRTRAEAEQKAIIMLAGLIAKERSGMVDEAAPPVVLYRGHELALDPELLVRVKDIPRVRRTLAVKLLDEMEDRIFPDGFDQQLLETLPLDETLVLVTTLHFAALAGILRYPENQPATPSHHTAVNTTQ